MRQAAFFLCCILLLLSPAVRGEENVSTDTLEEIFFEADESEFFLDGDNFIKKFSGHVRARTEDMEIFSDKALYNRDKSYTILTGNTVLKDSIRTIQADTIEYLTNSHTATARGHVRIIEKDRSLTASFVRYFRDSRAFLAKGDTVRLIDIEENAELQGREVFFDDVKDYGFVTGDPFFKKRGDESFTITCSDTIFTRRQEKEVRFWRNVHIKKGNSDIFGDEAVYINLSTDEEERSVVIIRGSPRVIQTDRTTDSETGEMTRSESQATGDSIKIFIEEGNLSRVLVSGNARGYYYQRDQEDSLMEAFKLTANGLEFEIEEGSLRVASAGGMAESFYRQIKGGETEPFFNRTLGDTIRFYFKDGKIQNTRTFNAGGVARGMYYEHGPFEEQ